MCIDHPDGAVAGRPIEDRRIITYGENPQADVRLVGSTIADGQLAVLASLFRDRAGDAVHEIDGLSLPMPGGTTRSTPRPPWRSRTSSALPTSRSARRSPASAA